MTRPFYQHLAGQCADLKSHGGQLRAARVEQLQEHDQIEEVEVNERDYQIGRRQGGVVGVQEGDNVVKVEGTVAIEVCRTVDCDQYDGVVEVDSANILPPGIASKTPGLNPSQIGETGKGPASKVDPAGAR